MSKSADHLPPGARRISRLDTKTLLAVAGSIATSVGAQLLLRHGMEDLQDLGGIALYLAALGSWWVPAGIVASLVSTAAWLVVLSRLDLAVAYPLGSLNYVLVTLLSATVLSETVPPLRWAGTALILAGILIIALGERRGPNPTAEKGEA